MSRKFVANIGLSFLFCLFNFAGLTHVAGQTDYTEEQNKSFEMMSRSHVFGAVLSNTKICKDLEIVASQKAKIKKIIADHHAKFGDIVNSMTAEKQNIKQLDISESEKTTRFTAIDERMESVLGDLITKTNSELQESLLPHQYKRLDQLVVQKIIMEKSRGRAGSPFQFIISELGLSSSEEAECKKKIDEIEEEFKTAQEELRKKFGEKVLAAVPPEARKRLKDLLGEFSYPSR